MICIDGQTVGAVNEGTFLARYPQLGAAAGIVRYGSIVNLVLTRPGTFARHVHLLAVRAHAKVIESISAAGTKSAVNMHPSLPAIGHVIGDRHVVQLARRWRRDPTDVDRAAIGSEGDYYAIVCPGGVTIPDLRPAFGSRGRIVRDRDNSRVCCPNRKSIVCPSRRDDRTSIWRRGHIVQAIVDAAAPEYVPTLYTGGQVVCGERPGSRRRVRVGQI